MGWQSMDLLALEPDFTGDGLADAHDGIDRGGLPHSVAADQRYRFAFPDMQGDADQNLRIAVACLHFAQLEQHLGALERDDFSSNRHPALLLCLSMIFSENRYP